MADGASESTHCQAGATLAADSQSGGGPIGAEKADVSNGHAVSRSEHGQTEPGTSPQSPPKNVREFEQAMRELGYSKRQARAIAAAGFKALGEAEPPDDTSELAELIRHNTDVLERIERTHL